MMADVSPAVLGAVTLIPLLVWACVTDVRSRRIPNAAVAAIAVTGLAASLLFPSPLRALASAGGGMATGLLVWLPFYMLGMLGAGDVKLFAAAGAWLGPRGALVAALLAALAGGLLAVGFMLAERGAVVTLLRLRSAVESPGSLREADASRRSRLPYGLAMAAGVLGVYLPSVL
jgi:prepilin peptidase CpaA